MAFPRVEKTDPRLYRVEQAGEGEQRQRRDQGERKKEDKFERPPLWKRMLGIGAAQRTAPTILGERPRPLATQRPEGLPRTEAEGRASESLLVTWGIVDPQGRPRILVVLTYTILLGLIVGGTVLIIGMALWR